MEAGEAHWVPSSTGIAHAREGRCDRARADHTIGIQADHRDHKAFARF